MRKWKDCPECETTTTPGRCKLCGNSGSIPLRPPMAEGVVYRNFDDVAMPMIVDSSELGTDVGGQAHVFVSGYAFLPGEPPSVLMLKKTPGPSNAPGHWDWRGEPS